MLCGATQPNAQPPKTSSKHSPICTHSCGICQLVRLYQPLHTRCASTSPFYHPLLCSHAFALLEFLYALQLCHSLISQPVKQSVSTSEPYALLFACVCVCVHRVAQARRVLRRKQSITSVQISLKYTHICLCNRQNLGSSLDIQACKSFQPS